MYLHLGQDVVIRTKDLLAIFDIENTSISKKTRDFLADAQKKGQIVTVTAELPKSVVLCEEKGKTTVVYLSQISPSTLRKRMDSLQGIDSERLEE